MAYQRNFNEILTKSQRFCLWQNVVAKRFATSQNFVKTLGFFDFCVVAKRFATTFCHKKNSLGFRQNFVKISLVNHPSQQNFNEISTKF